MRAKENNGIHPCKNCIYKHKLTVESPCYSCIDLEDLMFHRPIDETNFVCWQKDNNQDIKSLGGESV